MLRRNRLPAINMSESLRRLYPLRYHEVQSALWRSPYRFNIVPSGRRSGKSEIVGKRKVVKAALKGTKYDDPRFGIGAPTRDQVKRIYWNDIKAMIHPSFIRSKSETELSLTLVNNSAIFLLGMDKPERVEGPPWDGFVLDEYGNMKSSVWPEHVRPSLADREGWCDFIGVPEGRNHYYELDLSAQADIHGEWGRYHWISADILSEKEIESARRDLDEMTYLQEFEGSFLSFQGTAYYNFSERNKMKVSYDPQADLNFCYDFNVAPGVAAVIQEHDIPLILPGYKETLTAIVGEVHIPKHSNTIKVTDKLVEDWSDHQGDIIVYGDASGGAEGSAKVVGTDWELVKKGLYTHFGRDRVRFNIKKKNPRERVRVNAMNSRIKSYNNEIGLVVNPRTAPYTVKDFEGVSLLDGSNGKIDKKADPKLTHITDAIGYYVEKKFPIKEYTKSTSKYWK